MIAGDTITDGILDRWRQTPVPCHDVQKVSGTGAMRSTQSIGVSSIASALSARESDRCTTATTSR